MRIAYTDFKSPHSSVGKSKIQNLMTLSTMLNLEKAISNNPELDPTPSPDSVPEEPDPENIPSPDPAPEPDPLTIPSSDPNPEVAPVPSPS